MESVVFKILVVLGPLPIAVLFYRIADIENSESNTIEGKFSELFTFKFTGAAATYFIALGILVFSFFPSTVGLNLKNEISDWRFDIEYRRSTEPDTEVKSHSGRLQVTKLPGWAGDFSGRFENNPNIPPDETRWDAQGLYGKSRFYIPITLPNIDRKVAAMGSWNSATAKASLKMFSLAEEDATEKPVYGLMTLVQNFPWLQLAVMALVPFVVV